MINWLARWFIRSPVAAAISAPLAAPDAPAAAGPGPDLPDAAGSRARLYHWLAGPGLAEVLPSTEKLIIDELARLAEAPQSAADLVPRVPAVLPELLRSLRDDSVSGADLSRQLAQDVVLVAEVIREANRPCYRQAAPVKTIEGAVMVLGQNGMRMLLARVAFRPVISSQSGRFARLLAPAVWRQSETCALAASMLAPIMRANPFECYLAGLLNNVGLIVALRLIDQIYTGHALPRSDQFVAGLLANARLLSSRIAALWEFPAAVSDAIAGAGMPYAPPIARVLAAADLVATLRMLADAGQLEADHPALLALEPAALACFEQLRNEDH